MVKVIWTGAALRDLENVQAYIAHDSPRYAERFALRLIDAGDDIGLFPGAGRVVAQRRGYEIHERLVGVYRLLYVMHNEACFIVGVVHGQRDLEAWLEERKRDLPPT
jgi:plasmid stabilization system protein ParE